MTVNFTLIIGKQKNFLMRLNESYVGHRDLEIIFFIFNLNRINR
jgi:hypothetical protein